MPRKEQAERLQEQLLKHYEPQRARQREEQLAVP